MLELLKENAGTVFIAAVVLLVLVSALIKIKRDKKNGGGCGCGCSGCPSAGMCHADKEQTDNKG